MLELAKFATGSKNYYAGMFYLSPWLIAMKAGLISRTKAKEKLLTHFFGGYSIERFNEICLQFSEEILPGLIRQTALEQIKNFQQNHTTVVVVTASAEDWVAPWCRSLQLQYLCTQLEIKEGIVTGKLAGPNCNGKEKVCRIQQTFSLYTYKNIYCYGDSSGDKPMLEIGTEKYYRHFTT